MAPMNARLLRPLASGGFPKSLPSLGFWYDPSRSSTVTLNGGNVSELKDLSGNGRHLTQSTALNQPPYSTTAISRPVLDFGISQSSRSLTWTPGSVTSDWREMFIVTRYDYGATSLGFEGLISALDPNNTGVGLSMRGNGFNNFFTTNTPATSHIWDWLSINGGAYSFVSPTGGINGWPVLPAIQSLCVLHAYADSQHLCTGLALGSDRDFSSRGWLGLIGETFACETGLTAAQRTDAINYLKTKWGIA